MPFAQAVRGRAPGGREQQMVLRQDLPPQRSGAADQAPVPDPGPPSDDAPRALAPSRLLPWLGRLGVPAAAFAVFQALLGILPQNLAGEAARYCVAATAGVGVGAVVWLAAALLRARGAAASAVPPPVPVPSPAGSLPELVDGTYQALRRGLAVIEVPGRGPLTGWPHSLAESEPPVHPTAFGTAYGLHLLLDIAPYDGRIRAGEVAETLWRLRLPGGGWAARSQGSGARPEVSAIVLGALARAGADPRLLEAEIRSCEVLWDPDHDASGLANTYVVTNVLRGLLRAAPGATALGGLREACWSTAPRPIRHATTIAAGARRWPPATEIRRRPRCTPRGRWWRWTGPHGCWARTNGSARCARKGCAGCWPDRRRPGAAPPISRTVRRRYGGRSRRIRCIRSCCPYGTSRPRGWPVR
ncbi:hypothetical protein RB199_06210 [Streptomyces libani]